MNNEIQDLGDMTDLLEPDGEKNPEISEIQNVLA